ncbi:TetR/AcrR family transcriptional regulator [Microbacterium sp. NPDC058342]|uniref:TetR/AcrR family transcriptional regulator n=1 Tax=Microbacterium sp. NPDC058342 TaxID=3346454 RepID=UPI0036687637
MARWAPDSRGRLESAALELFEAKGFASTTVPEIAELAGLTTRTFFRHFADKREVLFADGAMTAYARQVIEAAPSDLAPIEIVRHLLQQSVKDQFRERKERVRRVRAIIATDQMLREREFAKRHDLSRSVEDGLIARGIDDISSRLLADLAVTVMYLAVDRWLESPAPGTELSTFVDEIMDVHAAVTKPDR